MKQKTSDSFASGWYRPPTWQWLLLPIMMLFAVLSSMRRICYRLGILSAYKSQIPVIVVGNITVGGNGKTPVVSALIEHFLNSGLSPVLLTRGYGGTCKRFPHVISPDDTATFVGDEPAMIKGRYNISVIVDPKRKRGMRFIEHNISADVVICDDGLQHYALGRDIECCVMDSRGVGNGYLLPLGPLREGHWRLNTVDFILVNGEQQLGCLTSVSTSVAHFVIAPQKFINVKNGKTLSLHEAVNRFCDKETIALAGIGDPERFYSTLASIGIAPRQQQSFADHHVYKKDDLPDAEIVIMTEKDAIKCKEIASENCWYLQINAELPNHVYDYINAKLAA
ncbi:MAG: tetraacyldisaccharide 4'-kinase [Pseudomonadota bacterium]